MGSTLCSNLASDTYVSFLRILQLQKYQTVCLVLDLGIDYQESYLVYSRMILIRCQSSCIPGTHRVLSVNISVMPKEISRVRMTYVGY